MVSTQLYLINLMLINYTGMAALSKHSVATFLIGEKRWTITIHVYNFAQFNIYTNKKKYLILRTVLIDMFILTCDSLFFSNSSCKVWHCSFKESRSVYKKEHNCWSYCCTC